ncbi:hypothetical protein [Micromonospora sp. RTP1Z1]|uniref:hypothetical protein n=1 Tax=Micromonospora sp. RTP1Z1 TaxID=2994043 RepID=UPI0029C716DD|nr:hypothetical protein [Micromonospora sp. RTP1Z1]
MDSSVEVQVVRWAATSDRCDNAARPVAYRRGLLDRMLIFGRRHPESVVVEYVDHYNSHRPHRPLAPAPPLGAAQPPVAIAGGRVLRRDRLGGLIGECSQAA